MRPATASTCAPWPGEIDPLPTTLDSDPFLARWAELRAAELARLAAALDERSRVLAAPLWAHAACLAPRRDDLTAAANAEVRPVRVHRPSVVLVGMPGPAPGPLRLDAPVQVAAAEVRRSASIPPDGTDAVRSPETRVARIEPPVVLPPSPGEPRATGASSSPTTEAPAAGAPTGAPAGPTPAETGSSGASAPEGVPGQETDARPASETDAGSAPVGDAGSAPGTDIGSAPRTGIESTPGPDAASAAGTDAGTAAETPVASSRPTTAGETADAPPAEALEPSPAPAEATPTRVAAVRPAPTPEQAPPSEPPRWLAEAERAVLEARFEEALTWVERGRMAGSGSGATRAELEVLAGTAQLALGRAEAARSAFASALDADPALVLDPLRHSPKVVAVFESVRASRDETP